jgi:hypothetical protein
MPPPPQGKKKISWFTAGTIIYFKITEVKKGVFIDRMI